MFIKWICSPKFLLLHFDMMYKVKKYKRIFILIGAISLVVPLIYISYKLITSEGSSTTISVNSLFGYLLILYYAILFGFIIAFMIHWIVKNIKSVLRLKSEKKKTELMHLKSQVNPHFFFNILNNLYGMVDTDTEKAKQLILKLSGMMRYSIYEGQKNMVTVKEEVNFINNFIDLHKTRYHKTIDVVFISDIKNEEVKITPLLFIILVENAFKHGVEVLRRNAFVKINLKTDNTKIYFEVENNYDKEHKTKEGIGLKNLRRRLHLSYPRQHNFTTSTTDTIFKSKLIIYLHD